MFGTVLRVFICSVFSRMSGVVVADRRKMGCGNLSGPVRSRDAQQDICEWQRLQVCYDSIISAEWDNQMTFNILYDIIRGWPWPVTCSL